MIIYFSGFALLLCISIIDIDRVVLDKKYIQLRILFFSVVTLVMIFFAGFRVPGVGVDDKYYVQLFKDARHGILHKEISFYIFSNIFNRINYVFILFALIGVGLKGYFILKNTKYFGIVFFLYFSSYFFLHDFVQIRAGVASALILWILYSAGQRSYFKYFGLSLLAIFFHLSAICILPVIFLSNKNSKLFYVILGLVSLLLAFVFPLNINELASYLPEVLFDRISFYLAPEENFGINLLNPIALIHYFMAIIIFIFWDKLVSYSDSSIYIIKTFLIGIYLFLIFHSIDIVFRIYELFMITQIPLADMLIQSLKQKYVMIPLMLLLCVLYFYYYVIKMPVINPFSFYF
jgi:hypothetical protein